MHGKFHFDGLIKKLYDLKTDNLLEIFHSLI